MASIVLPMSELSPYAPPRADGYAAPAAFNVDLQDATLGIRFANFFIDSIGRMVFVFMLVIPFSLLKLEALGGIAVLVGLVGYHFIFEATLGRTPGKFLTGTRVVSANGDRASTGQIFGRTLARFVPFEPLSFLFGGNPPNGWHDKWSNTRVVKI
jgi:uncharacterized RDD family membrane protein YckC